VAKEHNKGPRKLYRKNIWHPAPSIHILDMTKEERRAKFILEHPQHGTVNQANRMHSRPRYSPEKRENSILEGNNTWQDLLCAEIDERAKTLSHPPNESYPRL
jgi:hypothetical protein